MRDPLVDVEWVWEQRSRLVIVDATYLMFDTNGGKSAFEEQHIPSAIFFDISAVSDITNSLPHMLPSVETFAEMMGKLGVASTDTVVVYDQSDNHFSSPRAWKTFRAFGQHEVYVLNGGFAAWVAQGYPTECGPARNEYQIYKPPQAHVEGVLKLDDVQGLIVDGQGKQIVDARDRDRFEGNIPDKRPGLRSGHIPGSRNLPYSQFTRPDGRFVEPDQIRQMIANAGIGESTSVVTTCGSGISASGLSLAFARVGRETDLYDGSWAEWGSRQDTPVERGPPSP